MSPLEDLGTVIEADPELLDIRSGCFGRIGQHYCDRKHLAEARIVLVVQRTGFVCRVCNSLHSSRCLAITLHLAC